MDKLKKDLEQLVLLPGLSGHEGPVGRFIRQEFARYTKDIRFDTAGNITAVFEGKEPGGVMVFAHMDQLGLVVRKVDENGFVWFERLGGIPEKILPGLEVIVESNNGGYLPGVIGNRSHHITPPEDKYKVIPYKDLYIDMGFSSAAEVAKAGIGVGAPVVYKPRFGTLAGGACYGTAMDNRGGCAILLALARHFAQKKPPRTVYLTATVQEEYNLRGGMVAAANLKPVCAIALDVALTGDTPDTQGAFPVGLGMGAVVSLYNFHGRGTLNGTIPHAQLVERAEAAAKKRSLPLQRFATIGMLTDASYVQLQNGGIPCIDLGFPCRYTHTAVELCDPQDLVALTALVSTMVDDMGAGLDFTRRYE